MCFPQPHIGFCLALRGTGRDVSLQEDTCRHLWSQDLRPSGCLQGPHSAQQEGAQGTSKPPPTPPAPCAFDLQVAEPASPQGTGGQSRGRALGLLSRRQNHRARTEVQCNCSSAPSSGLEGQLCEVETNECASAPCLNHANCQDQLNGFLCVCQPGECQAQPTPHRLMSPSLWVLLLACRGHKETPVPSPLLFGLLCYTPRLYFLHSALINV